jgi:hypothetical protein
MSAKPRRPNQDSDDNSQNWGQTDFSGNGFPAGDFPAFAFADTAISLGTGIPLTGGMSFAKGGSGGSGGSGGGSGGVMKQYFSGGANGTTGYDIWIEFKGTGWSADLQKAFIQAADYFTTGNPSQGIGPVITEDIGGGGLYRGKIVDDLYVSAELAVIDGPGDILGQAGPTAVWTATELTAAGQMKFDVADAETFLGAGLWQSIVTHELMHVLGFGSLWNYGKDPVVFGNQYIGPNGEPGAGLEAYQEVFPNEAFIPVETAGGSGTAGAHWDEIELDTELMTGYIDATNYLSKFSVMSLADLGYTGVNYHDYPYDGFTA